MTSSTQARGLKKRLQAGVTSFTFVHIRRKASPLRQCLLPIAFWSLPSSGHLSKPNDWGVTFVCVLAMVQGAGSLVSHFLKGTMYLKKMNILSVQSELKWIAFLQLPGATLSSWYMISSLMLTQTCEINIILYLYPWRLTYWYATNLPACSTVSTLSNYFNGLFSKSLSVSSDCHNKNAMKTGSLKSTN